MNFIAFFNGHFSTHRQWPETGHLKCIAGPNLISDEYYSPNIMFRPAVDYIRSPQLNRLLQINFEKDATLILNSSLILINTTIKVLSESL